ncbi:hypothetical protein A2U01_0103210, partial [Trifolium medium]|nr:hypothetical protein [Trifolium medium]
MSGKDVPESLKEHAEMFMMLPIVCEFPDVFLEDISDVPPERE